MARTCPRPPNCQSDSFLAFAYVAHSKLQQREDHSEGRERSFGVLDSPFMLIKPLFQRI